MTTLGPNARRLVTRKLAVDAIPAGSPDPFAAGLRFLSDPGLGARAQAAEDWVKRAIALVKGAPDNPYGNDDEVIAAELLRRVETRQELHR